MLFRSNESDTAYATLAYGTENITSNVRAVFTGWSGDASGTGLTSDPILMNDPKIAVADWKMQYYLDVVTDPSSLPPIPGADWYYNCTLVSLTAPQYVPDEVGIGGVRYRFSYWDVDGTSQGTGTNPIQVNMDAPHTATAHYVKQYYLTVETDPTGLNPAPLGEGWYDESTHLNMIAPPVSYNTTSHEEYVFVYWDVDGTNSTSNDVVQVHMDMPHVATAHYWLPRPLHLDAEPPRLINLAAPLDTQWDELYPEYARHYELQSWHDTNHDGRLSPCDYVDLWDEDHHWELTPYFWHVDDITVT